MKKIESGEWKTFTFSDVFEVRKGFYNNKPDASAGGTIPFIGATDKNNGVTSYHTLKDISEASKTGDDNNAPMEEKIFPPHAVCVTNDGSVGYAYYQPRKFTCSHSVNPLYRKDGIPFNHRTGLFIATVIMQDRYRWQYGRKWRPARMIHSTIDLPATKDGTPDWKYMEEFIERLETRERESKSSTRDSLRTENKSNKAPHLDVNNWVEFRVKDLFYVEYGVNLELSNCEEIDNGINFVSRTADNNGVSAQVGYVEGVQPQQAGLITVAGGGSVLSTFLQDKPFYSGRDLFTLRAKEGISKGAKLFIITIIERNKYKYNYGRQANKTLPNLVLMLPIKRDSEGSPIIDDRKTHSTFGYIPDWEFMENYIKSLPYGDMI